jgi:phosphosulfolactate synthase
MDCRRTSTGSPAPQGGNNAMASVSNTELLSFLGRNMGQDKPRENGQTWVSFFGEGLSDIGAFLEVAAPYIDRAKIAYGSAVLASPEMLRDINALLKAAAVEPYPGGTLLEMALYFGRLDEFIDWARGAGFTGLEICDGVIEMSDELRADTIRRAVDEGFHVTSVVQEVVRKPVVDVVPLEDRIERVRRDLEAGATRAHIVFQAIARGEVSSDMVGPIKARQAERLVEEIGADLLVWEAQGLEEQVAFLRLFGSTVNLGHVQPRTAVQLEAQRRGLGYESFWSEVWKRPHWS